MNSFELEIVSEILKGKELQPKYKFDINKIQYNNYYHSVDFWKTKFPKGYDKLIGFDKIIEHYAHKAKTENKTPLDEMIKLSEIILE
jgi:hypothetical protein